MNLAPPLKLAEPAAKAQRPRPTVKAALTFRRGGARSFLAHQYMPHPFHMTRPFYLAGDPAGMATLYLQSSSGGLYGDDDLRLQIALEDRAKAHVTSQASTVVHAARGGTTRQSIEIDCGRESWLEYLPDPLILFSGACLRATIGARIDRGATLILADAFLSHDPTGSGAPFERYESSLEIRRVGESRPLLIERFCPSPAAWPPAALTAGPSFPCYGSLCLLTDDPITDAVAAIKQSLGAAGLDGARCYSGVSALPERGIVLTRILCRDGATLSAALEAAWRGARQALTGKPPPPRNK